MVSAERPDILDVPPASRAGALTPLAARIVRAAYALITVTSGLYSNRSTFWLARDMEYFHDVARLAWNAGDVQDCGVLIDVSRESAYDPLLQRYCAAHSLTKDSRALLIDCGVHGNVLEAIEHSFPEADIRGILIHSLNRRYPSVETALMHLANCGSSRSRSSRSVIEQEVEALPHFNSAATGYSASSSEILVTRGRSPLGAPDKPVDFMRHLKHAWGSYREDNEWRLAYESFRRLAGLLLEPVFSQWPKTFPLAALQTPEAASANDSSRVLSARVMCALADFERYAQVRLSGSKMIVYVSTASVATPLVERMTEIAHRLGPQVSFTETPAIAAESVDLTDSNLQRRVADFWASPVGEDPDRHSNIAEEVQRLRSVRYGRALLKDLLIAAEHGQIDGTVDSSSLRNLWHAVLEISDGS